MIRPIVTFTTDFSDGLYLAQMKGVVLTLCREATLVDISHEVPRHDVAFAAGLLREAVPTFPPGTVHLAVVDPGVGTARRGLAVRTDAASAKGQYLIGPDNGLFTELFEDSVVHELGPKAPRNPVVSAVFHGRDLFAPCAAHLARGGTVESFGPKVTDAVRLEMPKAILSGREIAGSVVYADRFGNLTTNIEAVQLARLGERGWYAEIGGVRVDRVVRAYGDAQKDELVALVGSSDRLEIAVREGSAAERLKLVGAGGTAVRVAGK